MFFNSIHFLIFAPLAIAGFFALRFRLQRVWLLLASLYFYAVFEPPFILLLIADILITHLAVRGMMATEVVWKRRLWLGVAIAANLAILYFFKFIDFSFEVFNVVFQYQAGESGFADPTGVMLPVGISFFTLQAIAYAVDVYRRDIEGEKRLTDFALFLSFFPQLVAGPIMRAGDLLHQFGKEHRFEWENIRVGLGIVALGFFKKTMVADPASLLVDEIFANPDKHSSMANLLGSFLFAIQVYGDFSGYSDIAIGTGRIMGFKIPRNFLRPFLSKSLGELWNRWHISLSTWLRDYIYIPLGGSRVSMPRFYFNMIITMVLSGVWHGAGFNYVAWGGINAIIVALERFLLGRQSIKNIWDRTPNIFKILYAFSTFVLGATYFRARALPHLDLSAAEVATYMLGRMFQFEDGLMPVVPQVIWLSILMLVVFEVLQEWKPQFIERLGKNQVLYYSVCLIVIGYCGLVFAMSDSSPFVYFQF